jgi:integrase
LLLRVLSDEYLRYLKKLKNGTLGQYKAKIEKFTDLNYNKAIDIAFEENNVKKFIFSKKSSSKRLYNAIQGMHEYAVKNGFIERKYFPIKVSEVEKFDLINNNELETSNLGRNKGRVYFFSDEIDFEEFLDEKYYSHLQCMEIIIAVRAMICVGMMSGLKTGQIKNLRMKDVIIEEELIKIKIDYKNNIENVVFDGNYLDIIRSYDSIRRKINDKSGRYFVKVWNSREVNLDKDFGESKIKSDPINMVNYMLGYISSKCEIGKVSIQDFQSNMIYKVLQYSKGTRTGDLLRIFGYVPNFKCAFERYFGDLEEKDMIISDFF